MKSSEIVEDTKSRLEYWDNLKGILIFLVVIGHFFYEFRLKNEIICSITNFIYLFHMPAFVFVSGYFCRGNVNYTRIKKYIFFYLIGNTFMMLFSYIYMNNKINLLVPYYSFWYLIALIVWRISINFLKNVKGILPISIIVALLIGFFPKINNTLVLCRIICFFPFILLGIKAYHYQINLIIEKNKCLIRIISILIFMCIVIISKELIPQLSFGELLMYPYNNNTDILHRLLIFIIAILMIFILLSITPNKKKFFLTKIGRNSLYIYIYHRIITLIIPILWTYENNTILTIGLSFISSIFICLTFGSDTMKNITEKAYNKLFNNKKMLCLVKKILKVFVIFIIIGILILPLKYRLNNTNQNVDDKMHKILSNEEKQKIENSFSILFAGDLILLKEQVKRGYNNIENTYNFDDIFEYTNKYIKESDLGIGVFEGPMAGESLGYSNSDLDDEIKIYLNFPDEFGQAVKDSGFDLVTLANNHVFDKGIDGAIQTVNKLKQMGLSYTGFYENRDNVQIIEKGNLKIGVLSYTYGSNYWNETEMFNQKYVPIIVDEKSEYFEQVRNDVLNDFENLKKKNPDVIIVLPHYGTQFSHEIDDFQKTWNNIFLNAGANIILGDHSHSVQPIEIKKNCKGKESIIVNCPGNFANSYVNYDGDATAMVEIYLDENNGDFIASSIIPMWVQAKQDSNYRAIPIYDIFYDDKLKNEINANEMNRVETVFETITSVMLGKKLTIDNTREKLYYTTTGYKRDSAGKIEINKNSLICQLIEEANSVCFIGDSITEGTKNGGYGWYEPLINCFNKKDVFNISKGGATSKTIIELVENNNRKCDLYVIAIGTNDIRYRYHNLCAMNEAEYIDNLKLIIETIKNSNARFVFIAPWNSLENDTNSKLEVKEKQKYMDIYSATLKEFCDQYNYLYINPNEIIFNVLNNESYEKYLVDFIHPNNKNGIELYSNAVQEACALITK